MSYRWVDHTAEVELEIEAASERAVLGEAVRAVAELLGVQRPSGQERRTVVLEAGDRPALLAGWIEELAFLAESEGFVAGRLLDVELASNGLRATITGTIGEPPPLIKAVTYHRLAFERRGDGYVARVVLDV